MENTQQTELYQQLLCEECGIGLIPVYNKENNCFKLHCPKCGYSWSMPLTVQLTDGISIYNDFNK